MRCPRCGFDNPEAMNFCGQCATALGTSCARCGLQNPPGFSFCGGCGAPLSASRATLGGLSRPSASAAHPVLYTPPHIAERIRAEGAALERRGAATGERKTVTALFADIKGSMELIEDLDPEEARRIVDPALELMMDAVHRYDGYVAQSTGDGIFALFGAPIAHEDHPQRALFAALRMQEDGRRHAERLRQERGLNLQIRVGVNTGEVVLRAIRKDDLQADYVPVGHSTGLAARMEAMATPGSILVTEQTFKLTDGYFAFRALGPARVKGASEPVNVYEVLGPGPLRTRLEVAARRGLARFVGRRAERDQLVRALELARAGHGQVVGVVGEPGVGKSRLFHEFKLLPARGDLRLETFSVSHGKAYAYLPLIEMARSYFQITLEDDERRRREKITGRVLTLDRSLEDALPYLFVLLGVAEPGASLDQMHPEIKRLRTLDAVKRLLLRESLNQPIQVLFEDLHWLDVETQAFLDMLVESLANARLLLLVNYRPEYRHAWGGKTYYTQLRLDPLGHEDARTLLSELLGEGPAVTDLRQLVLARTEGNPFFIEEIVQALFDEGTLVRDGVVRLTRPLGDVHVPPTVEGMLSARIDRLPSAEKDLLQAFSVLGREFPAGLVKSFVQRSEDELDRDLANLQRAEFIYEEPAFPEPRYSFKHALTQEVAYHSILSERRRALHEQAARGIQALFAERLDEHWTELARHWERSGNVENAVEALQRAAEHAIRRAAYADGIAQLTRALELLESFPDSPERARQELALRSALTPMLASVKGQAPEVGLGYARLRKLAEGLGDSRLLVAAMYGLHFFHQMRGDLVAGRQLAEQVLAMAERQGDPRPIAEACAVLGQDFLFLGELATARARYERAVALLGHERGSLPGHGPVSMTPAAVLSFWARLLWLQGYPDQARRQIDEALRMARDEDQPQRLAAILYFAAVVHENLRDVRAARADAEASMALSTQHGFPLRLAQATQIHGWALAHEGRADEGIAEARRAQAAYRAVGGGLNFVFYLVLLADACWRAGRAEEGLEAVSSALAAVESSGERAWEAEVHRLRGELLLAWSAGASGEAEHAFRQAIELAGSSGARSLELRAATSLGRLLVSQGRSAEARSILKPIHDWFTEGFDTRDLLDAAALLADAAPTPATT